MTTYNIDELNLAVGGNLAKKGLCNSISRVSTDSRTLIMPEETVFFSLKTKHGDGHKYIEELYGRGVRTFVVEKYDECYDKLSDASFVVVSDSLKALQKLSKSYRMSENFPSVIGVTGSNGKTIVKEWLFQLLNSSVKIERSPRSYNSQIGVPLSILGITKDADIAIIEAGMSHKGEMENLASIIQPQIGVFTCLRDAHQENFGSMREKCMSKLSLFCNDNCEKIIYDKRDRLVDICMRQKFDQRKLYTYGGDDADINIISCESHNGNTKIKYKADGTESEYEIPFADEASIQNSLSCLAVMLVKGYRNIVEERMSKLEPVEMRLEVKDGLDGCIIIDDSYNSDLSSLSIALDTLKLHASDKRKKTLILSDIQQSGMNPDELYSSVISLVKEKQINRFIAIGQDLMKYCNENEADSFYLTTDDFLSHLGKDVFFENEAILIKGARSFHFEDISDALSDAVHQTVLEVNLSSLVRNYNDFRSKLTSETKMVCMVKANAYGSGDIEVAKCLQNAGADYLAVAVADEGETLRKAGITVPIMVMNPEMNSFRKLFQWNLEPEVYSFTLLRKVIHEAMRHGLSDYPVHIKIDSGMHRLGFAPEDIDEVIKILSEQNYVTPRSVFSHLVGSDSDRFDSFTEEQIRRFSVAKDKIQNAYPGRALAHILNSAGIERFTQYQFDMVRLGIGLYGFTAVDDGRLEEVCTLKTKILQIREVEADETIGYSRNGKLNRKSVIGAIPIGYADGLDRHLGNRVGEVLVNGHIVPIVGNVCMDVCMIDLTGIDAKEGDDVILFGPQYSVRNMANKLGTITYEVISSISRRVKRVYTKE